ncbi:MAG: hypothetical protein VKN83_02320 [Cyanobacteriota bacterium]|nr:hypothetical protein [Cyanobacteriota bacterium]
MTSPCLLKGGVLPGLSLATAALVALPTAPLQAMGPPDRAADSTASLLARGGGGGGGRGGGGRGGGGGVRGGGASRARTGFSGGGNFSRGDRKPSGGFSSGDRLNRVGNPSISRPASRPDGFQRQGQGLQRQDGGRSLGDRSGSLVDRNQPFNRQGTFNQGDRTFNQGNRTFNRDGDRNWNGNLGNRSVNIDRDWNREVNIGDVNLNPGWARPGWGVARPWNWGWYGGWSTPNWGWWGASAAAWGIGTLATAAIINDAVNDAVAQNVTYIVVPNTGYELQYGTIQPYGNYSVSFVVTANGTSYQLNADCNAGAINGRQPSSAQEAELLNAACQVAYGNAS